MNEMSDFERSPPESQLNDDPPDEDRLALAEQLIAGLQDEFAECADAQIARLTEICLTRWVKPARREAAIRQLRRIAHDLKGEAGTFGYDLVTEIAECFGVYLREVPEARQQHADMVRYVGAFHRAWGERLQGDGGAVGRSLLAGLAAVNAQARHGS